MRFTLIILLLLSTLGVQAQDSCKLSFHTGSTALTASHEAELQQKLENTILSGIDITGAVTDGARGATLRYQTELRMRSIKIFLLEIGVPLERMSSSIHLTENPTNVSDVVVYFDSRPKPSGLVLKASPIARISEVAVARPTVIKESMAKKESAADIVKNNEVLKLEEFKKNEKIRLPNLLFEPGTHFIMPGSETVLDELLAVMRAKPKLKIELQGHICCKLGGLDGYDPTTGRDNLSEMRAKVVFLYLISKGVDSERMTFKGFGSSRKIYQDDIINHAKAMQNRRVEVLVKSID